MSTESRPPADFQQTAENALSLPIDQRVELVQRLNDSINEAEPTPEHQERVMAIVRRRAEEMRQGTAKEVSHEDVMDFLNGAARCD
ncbi:MAG: addiction module protein [Planctomycetota bacterium]|nr:addiction module protein [Planctomycetota bacterium]